MKTNHSHQPSLDTSNKVASLGDLHQVSEEKKQKNLRNKNADNYLETIRENERLGGAKSQADRVAAASRNSVAPNYDEESDRESHYRKPRSKMSVHKN